MKIVKTNSNAAIIAGPFVSDVDGKTPIANGLLSFDYSMIRLLKDGSFAASNSSTTVSPMVNGFVTIMLRPADTNFLGNMTLSVKVSGSLSVWHDVAVVTDQLFNLYFGSGSNPVSVDLTPVTSILNDATTGLANIHAHAASVETELAKVVGKLPATGLISAQNDVVAIQNNTSFVTTLPDTAMIPTVIFPFKVNCFTYDTAGNMEDTDSGLYMKLETSYGVSRNDRMFSDTAMGTNLTLVTTGQFAGYVRFIPVDQGSWTGYYKASPTDDAELLVGTFKYIEGGVMKTYGRSIMLTKQNVGDVNIAATDANMGVIAKAIRGYDSSLMGLNPLSIEGRNWKDHVDIATAVSDVHQQTIFLSTQHDAIILQNGVTITDLNHIMPEIDHISTTVDTINSEATQILTELGNSLKLTTIIDGATLGKLLTALQAIAVGGADITDVAGGKRRITYKKNDGVTDAFTVETSGSGITRISW